MKYLEKPIKITVCSDGFLSLRFGKLKPRLGAALPCYSTDTVEQALELIKQIGVLTPCEGSKGVTVEFRAPDWVPDSLESINQLAETFF